MDIGSIVITILNDLGFFNVILPFMLVYAVMYGVLVRTQIFGDPFDTNSAKAKTVRSIISLVSASIAFLTVGSANVIINIREVVPYIVLYILIVFMLIMTIAVFYTPIGSIEGNNNAKNEYEKYRKYILGVSIFIFAILILYAFGIFSFASSSNITSGFMYFIIQNISFIAAIIVFLIMVGFVIWMTRPVSPEGSSSSSSTGNSNKSSSSSQENQKK